MEATRKGPCCAPGSRNPYLYGTDGHYEWCREYAINSAGLGRISLQEFNTLAKRLPPLPAETL